MTIGCGSEYFHAQALCEVSTKLDEISEQALLLKGEALDAISDINTAYENLVSQLPAGYVDLTGPINVGYTPPDVPEEPDFWTTTPDLPAEPDYSGLEPTPVTVPAASDVAIGDAEWQRINDQAAADLALSGVGEELAAATEASWRGAAVPAVISAMWASEAAQRTQDRISQARLVSAVEQAKAAREDIKELTQLAIANYSARANWVQIFTSAEASTIQAQVARYVAPVQYLQAATQAAASLVNARVELFKGTLSGEKIKAEIAEIDVKRLLEVADKTASYALERARMVEDRGVQVAERVAVLLAGVAQAFLSASSYSLSGSGSASVSTSLSE